jgi:hypothetical protein
MQFCPRFHEPPLTPRQRTCDQVDWLQTLNGDFVLIVSMKVWQVVRFTNFQVHPNDDAIKAA